jgi:hypothetical protein
MFVPPLSVAMLIVSVFERIPVGALDNVHDRFVESANQVFIRSPTFGFVPD